MKKFIRHIVLIFALLAYLVFFITHPTLLICLLALVIGWNYKDLYKHLFED
jgi:hypothetical protein